MILPFFLRIGCRRDAQVIGRYSCSESSILSWLQDQQPRLQREVHDAD